MPIAERSGAIGMRRAPKPWPVGQGFAPYHLPPSAVFNRPISAHTDQHKSTARWRAARLEGKACCLERAP